MMTRLSRQAAIKISVVVLAIQMSCLVLVEEFQFCARRRLIMVRF